MTEYSNPPTSCTIVPVWEQAHSYSIISVCTGLCTYIDFRGNTCSMWILRGCEDWRDQCLCLQFFKVRKEDRKRICILSQKHNRGQCHNAR